MKLCLRQIILGDDRACVGCQEPVVIRREDLDPVIRPHLVDPEIAQVGKTPRLGLRTDKRVEVERITDRQECRKICRARMNAARNGA
ncbi:MAG: hypothetical protein KKB75_02645 [Alphaproteobacteria bacterium]|nr:hypothetical protein [Alphaproteobacteria bacterium]MBU2195560.1 hypothetical protein [Alphaproteobacteria bacterium]